MSRGKEIARRLVRQLKRDLKGIGYGAKKRALESAGLSRSYLENVRPERIPLGNYFEMLEGVGIDPAHHVGRALGKDDPVADFISDARNLARTSGVPRIIKIAKKRGASGMPEDDGGVDLDAIHRRNFSDPSESVRLLDEAVAKVSGPTTQSKLLGIWATAQKASGDFVNARMALSESLGLVGLDESNAEWTALLCRVSEVLRPEREAQWALCINSYATVVDVSSLRLSSLAGNLFGMGVSRMYQGRYSEASAFVTAALPFSRNAATTECYLHAMLAV